MPHNPLYLFRHGGPSGSERTGNFLDIRELQFPVTGSNSGSLLISLREKLPKFRLI
jgi:hypothetical protein